MSVLIVFVAINYEEMLKKDFALKYILEVNVVAKPFGLIVFTKKSIVDFRLGSKYASVMEEVAFSKISKFSQKITILEYSFSNVVGLKEKCNSNFCVAPKNRLVKITQKK